MKILSAKQIQQVDKATIKNEPISELNLMERAAQQIANCLLTRFKHKHYTIFCGPGNNGGDGLALARILATNNINVVVVNTSLKLSRQQNPRTINLEKLQQTAVVVKEITNLQDFEVHENSVIIDALFGSGLNRPLNGYYAELVKQINKCKNVKIAIDIPSGLFADAVQKQPDAIKANFTLTLQFPKSCFFNAHTAHYVGEYVILDIQLNARAIAKQKTTDYFLTKDMLVQLYKPRIKFSYKNTYGHGLLVAGAKGTFGACLLSAKAALKGGVGLLDVAVPKDFSGLVHGSLPECMVVEDGHHAHLTKLPALKKYKACAIGPGIGLHKDTEKMVLKLLGKADVPLVLDADALNILSKNKLYFKKLPANSVLTPHVGEFKRLIGVKKLPLHYQELAKEFTSTYKCVLVLKDSITSIYTPHGEVFYADQGSAALATAGSGDVLSGLLLALLCNGYTAVQAALLGVWIHATAGKEAGQVLGLEGTLAGDIPNYFVDAFNQLK